jgi:hypothetical protein
MQKRGEGPPPPIGIEEYMTDEGNIEEEVIDLRTENAEARIRNVRIARIEREREEERERRRRAEEQRLLEVLEEWCVGCPFCNVSGYSGYEEHELEECALVEESMKAELLASARDVGKKMRTANQAGCRMCGIPQEICWTWQRDRISRQFRWSEKGIVKCQYGETALSKAVAVLMRFTAADSTGWVSKRFEEADRADFEGGIRDFKQSFECWIWERDMIGKYESNNACRVLMEFG